MKETYLASFRETVFSLLDDRRTLCVFPSETVRRSWLSSYTLRSDTGVILTRHAVSWDRFTERLHDSSSRVPISRAARYLFAYGFLEQSGDELLHLSQKSFPEMQKQYVHTIVTLLDRIPAIDHLRVTEAEAYDSIPLSYRIDIERIRSSYLLFLEEKGLFDSHYDEPRIPEDLIARYDRIAIIGPDLCSAFFEYEPVLTELPSCVLYRARVQRHEGEDAGRELVRYENERQELIAVCEQIRKLLDGGTHPQEIALSAGDLARMLPFIEIHAQEYDIPLVFSSGRYLSDYAAGRLFILMEELNASDFSFESVKRFLLAPRIPWKERSRHRGIIQKAIASDIRQIVSPAVQDQWKSLKDSYLNELFSLVRSCVRAKSPEQMLSVVNRMTRDFLDGSWSFDPSRESQSFESQALSASVQILVDLEAIYTRISPSRPVPLYSLFTTLLKRQTFYPASRETGIAVFDYPNGLALAARYHFFIGLTAQAVDSDHQTIPFLATHPLRNDSVNTALDSAFLSGDICRFSYAVSGYTSVVSLPPSRFLSRGYVITEGAAAVSIESREERLWRDGGGDFVASERQARGYKAALATVFSGKRIDMPRGDIYPLWHYLAGEDDRVHLSPTTLDMADACPSKFFASKVLAVRVGQWGIVQLDHRDIGSLQHEILARFYALMEEHAHSSREDRRELLRSLIGKLAADRRSLTPLFVTRYIRKNYLEVLVNIIDKEEDLFGPSRSIGLESALEHRLDSLPVILEGRIDRIFSYEAEGQGAIGILDYKKSYPPPVTQYRTPVYPLTSYQLPFYALLLEDSALTGGETITSGNYYSIKLGSFTQIWKREEELAELKRVSLEAVGNLLQRLQEGNLEAHISKRSCTHCEFRQICRRRYVLP